MYLCTILRLLHRQNTLACGCCMFCPLEGILTLQTNTWNSQQVDAFLLRCTLLRWGTKRRTLSKRGEKQKLSPVLAVVPRTLCRAWGVYRSVFKCKIQSNIPFEHPDNISQNMVWLFFFTFIWSYKLQVRWAQNAKLLVAFSEDTSGESI